MFVIPSCQLRIRVEKRLFDLENDVSDNTLIFKLSFSYFSDSLVVFTYTSRISLWLVLALCTEGNRTKYKSSL